MTTINSHAFTTESDWKSFKARCRDEENFKTARANLKATPQPTTPSERVIHSFRMQNGVQWTGWTFYVIDDNTWLQIEPCPIKAWHGDTIFLRGIWVEPFVRRTGQMSRIIDSFKKLCDQNGVSILLSSHVFENSSDCLDDSVESFKHYDSMTHIPPDLAFSSCPQDELTAAWFRRNFMPVRMEETETEALHHTVTNDSLLVSPGTIDREQFEPMIWFCGSTTDHKRQVIDMAQAEYLRRKLGAATSRKPLLTTGPILSQSRWANAPS